MSDQPILANKPAIPTEIVESPAREGTSTADASSQSNQSVAAAPAPAQTPNDSIPTAAPEKKPVFNMSPGKALPSQKKPAEAKKPADTPAVATEAPALAVQEPVKLQPPDDPTSLYLFGDPQSDRARLVAQSFLSSESMRQMAPYLIREKITDVLDVGCGDGQLTMTLSSLFPDAWVSGMDMDGKAIETARKNLSSATPDMSPERIHYMVGDAQQMMPDGPFDLIHMSAVLLHFTDASKVLKMALQRLKPGGYIWCKDVLSDWRISIGMDHTVWNTLLGMLTTTFKKIGRNMWIGDELEEVLRSAGYVNIVQRKEIYSINNTSFSGRTAMSICLGVVYNARKQIAMMNGITEGEVMALYKQLIDNTGKLYGQLPLIHTSAQRPK